jgi:hypothetical protein
MQDMKEEFNKNTEILQKKIKILGMKSSIKQIKTQLKLFPVDWTKLKAECQIS